MQLKDIIRYLDFGIHCRIWQCDAYTDPSADAETIYEGCVMDIPWYILDFYLYNDDDATAFDVRTIEDESILYISVVEKQKTNNVYSF